MTLEEKATDAVEAYGSTILRELGGILNLPIDPDIQKQMVAQINSYNKTIYIIGYINGQSDLEAQPTEERLKHQAVEYAHLQNRFRKMRDKTRLSRTAEKVLKQAYLKHVLDDESIGWDELCNNIQDVLCELIGDEAFLKWVEENKSDD